jgi:hypothetical protein
VVHQKVYDALNHLKDLHFVSFPATYVPLCCQFDTIQNNHSYNKHESNVNNTVPLDQDGNTAIWVYLFLKTSKNESRSQDILIETSKQAYC